MFKPLLRELCPPLLWRLFRYTLLPIFSRMQKRHIEWEYLPKGWGIEEENSAIKGWDVESVLEAYKMNWPTFLKNLEGTLPLGISPESDSEQRTDLTFHNMIMTYGYVLAYCCRNTSRISMLDWGGGIGHYYLISQKLLPHLTVEYHCKDFPRFVEYGKTLFPEAHFYSDTSCLENTYDFVLASTSLHYSRDWVSTLKGLAKAAAGHVFISRLPIVWHVPSYVMIQRPYQYGYNTEYPGWCLNHDEFLDIAYENQLHLIQEFVIQDSSSILRAPEQPRYFGFLFSSSRHRNEL